MIEVQHFCIQSKYLAIIETVVIYMNVSCLTRWRFYEVLRLSS